MTRLQQMTSISTAVAFTAFLGASLAAQPPQPTPAPPTDPKPAPQLRTEQPETKPAGMTLKGELVKVDTTAKMLTIKTDEGKTEQIRYTDETKVTGAQSGIAGLANQDGTDVTVKFTGTGFTRVATEIMVDKAKS